MNSYTYFQGSDQTDAFVTEDRIAAGFVRADPSLVDDVYYNECRDVSNQENTFVSPITYNPDTGIYTQTFPEEYHDFLRKFGQYVDCPEEDYHPQSNGWSYQEHQGLNTQAEQPTGFIYNPPTAPVQTPMSPMSAADTALMLQYIASPVLASPDPHHRRINSTSISAALDEIAPVPSKQQTAYVPAITPVQKVEPQDDIIQPHMIVPSQQELSGYLGFHRQDSKFKFPYQPSTGSWMKHLPHQDPSTEPCVTATSNTQLPSSPEQHQPCAALPVHNFYPVSDIMSPPSSPERGESDHSVGHRHRAHHSHSPKAKRGTPSRSWSPSRGSPSPRASSLGMRLSPLPYHKRAAAINERKPPLACLFCRGRKIACGAPIPGSTDNTCNQCARRHLKCEYPTESRRGMRRRKGSSDKVKTPAVKVSRKRATR